MRALAPAPETRPGECIAVLRSGLRPVTAYKHMEVPVDVTRTLLREVTARARSVTTATATPGQRVLAKKNIHHKTHAKDATACVASRAFYAASTRPTLGSDAPAERERGHNAHGTVEPHRWSFDSFACDTVKTASFVCEKAVREQACPNNCEEVEFAACCSAPVFICDTDAHS